MIDLQVLWQKCMSYAHYCGQGNKNSSSKNIQKVCVVAASMLIVQKHEVYCHIYLYKACWIVTCACILSYLLTFIFPNFCTTAGQVCKARNFKWAFCCVCHACTCCRKRRWTAKRIWIQLTANCSCYNSWYSDQQHKMIHGSKYVLLYLCKILVSVIELIHTAKWKRQEVTSMFYVINNIENFLKRMTWFPVSSWAKIHDYDQ